MLIRLPPLHVHTTQVGQVAASIAFVVLYIWSTYEPAARGSWRHMADLALSALFAADLAIRLKVGTGRLRDEGAVSRG